MTRSFRQMPSSWLLIVSVFLMTVGICGVLMILWGDKLLDVVSPSAVRRFTIDKPLKLDAQVEQVPVGGTLECSEKIDRSDLNIIVYVTGTEPEQEGEWRRSEVPCPATQDKLRWELPLHCVRFPREFTTFRLIAVLAKAGDAGRLPMNVQARDAADFRRKISEYTYLPNDQNCISPEFEVRREVIIVAATNTPTNTPVTPTNIPTPTPTDTPTPSPTAPSMFTPVPTAIPTPPTNTPTPTFTPTPLVITLLEPEDGRPLKWQVTLRWQFRELGSNECFSVRAWPYALGKENIREEDRCFHEQTPELQYNGGLGSCSGEVWWEVVYVPVSCDVARNYTGAITITSKPGWFFYEPPPPPTPTPTPTKPWPN